MRVLFTPWSQPTHYMQMVPLVWAFRAAGHDVRVACQPQSADAVGRSGLPVTVLGRGYDYLAGFQEIHEAFLRSARERGKASLETPAELPPEVRRELVKARSAPFVGTAAAMAPELVALAESWRPDLVVANPFVMAAPLAAHTAGAVLAHHLTGPAVERRTGFFPGSGADLGMWTEELIALYGEYSLEPRTEYADRTVDPCPASLQYPGIPGRMPIRFVPYNGAGETPGWLETPPALPRVCVTWGTTTSQLAGASEFLVPTIVKGLSELDVEVVVAVGASDRELIDASSSRVRVVVGLPLNALLPSCSAIVHQGGTGTMLTAASLGVPQVMAAGMPDQIATATRMAAAGSGVSLDPAGAVGTDAAAAVSAALSDEKVLASVAQLREDILAQPSPAELVGAFENLVA